MEEIKLPLCESPIKVYSNYAYVLSVLLNNEDAKEWFYCNFIQVKYIRDEGENRFFFNYSLGNLTKYFYNVPFLEVRSLSRQFCVKAINNIIDFLCNAIREGYYIMAVVDNYFLYTPIECRENHYMHILLLYGFNTDKRCFYSMGYNNHLYEQKEIRFVDFVKAITSVKGDNKDIRDDYVMLYKLQDKSKIKYLQEGYNYFSYKFNCSLFRRSLKEYLDSVCSDEHFNTFYEPAPKSEYGISYYEALMEYVQKHIDGIYKGHIYDVAFHGMLEHKVVMVQRLKYIKDKKYILNIEDAIKEYEDLAEKAVIVRNMVLKYNITNNIGLLLKINKYLYEMEKVEYSVVKNIIERLT